MSIFDKWIIWEIWISPKYYSGNEINSWAKTIVKKLCMYVGGNGNNIKMSKNKNYINESEKNCLRKQN